jgi:hypothetical protein
LLAKQGSIYEAIRAIKSDAFDCLIKGRDNDALLSVLAGANENACAIVNRFII